METLSSCEGRSFLVVIRFLICMRIGNNRFGRAPAGRGAPGYVPNVFKQPPPSRIQISQEPKCLPIVSGSMNLEIQVIPFEPFAWVAGKKTGEREDKLAERIRQEVPSH